MGISRVDSTFQGQWCPLDDFPEHPSQSGGEGEDSTVSDLPVVYQR